MNKTRLETLISLVRENQISTQWELQQMLAAEGYETSQSSLSRDIRLAGIRKGTAPDGTPCYRIASTTTQNDPINSKIALEYAHHLAIIKTRSGYASGIAADIDAHLASEVAGTIAGDDTILLIPRQGYSSDEITLALRNLFPQLTLLNKQQ